MTKREECTQLLKSHGIPAEKMFTHVLTMWGCRSKEMTKERLSQLKEYYKVEPHHGIHEVIEALEKETIRADKWKKDSEYIFEAWSKKVDHASKELTACEKERNALKEDVQKLTKELAHVVVTGSNLARTNIDLVEREAVSSKECLRLHDVLINCEIELEIERAAVFFYKEQFRAKASRNGQSVIERDAARYEVSTLLLKVADLEEQLESRGST